MKSYISDSAITDGFRGSLR